MTELSGRLSERVRFESRDEVRGLAGDLSAGWVFRFERWARVEPQPRAEQVSLSADTRHSARRWRVTIREGRRPGLDMRIRWRDEMMVPIGIETDPAKPGWIVIRAEEARD
jgi:head-tail adaptor